MNFPSPSKANVSNNSKYSRHKGYLKWELQNMEMGGAFDANQTSPDQIILQRERQPNSFMISGVKSAAPSVSPSVALGDAHEHVCCDKLDDLSRQYQLIINEQMNKLAELNLLIQQHSKLLIDSYNQGFEDQKGQQQREAQINENNRLLREKEKLIQEWEEKYNQEKKIGVEKEEEIKDLERQIKELSSKVTTTTSTTSLQDEVNTWKNKFITLNKQFNEAEQKLVVVENEIDMAKQQSKKETTKEQRSMSRRKTVQKDIPLP